MKTSAYRARRTVWLLSAVPALLATSALAQVAPPPVQPTVTQSAPTAPAPQPPTAEPAAPAPQAEAPAAPQAQAPAATGRGADPSSSTPVNPAAFEVEDEARQAARSQRRSAARPAARAVERRAPAAAPVAETPAPAPETAAPAPDAAAPATPPAATEPAPAPEATPPVAAAATTADSATTTDSATTEQGGAPVWPWIALGAVIVLGLALFLWRRRSANAYAEYDAEPVHAAPAAVAAEPVAVAPVEAAPAAATAAIAAPPRHDPVPTPAVAEDATVVDAGEAEVAALTDGAPAGDRPWLEFAMRPVRAGTNVDEALVEIELTIANAGKVAAQDVRVSTFMLTDAQASEVERLMVDPPANSAVEPVTIAPGEGTRIDATLAARKADVGQPGGAFTPVVVADARYRLPDGSEGRTSASFLVGVPDASGNIAPFAIDEREMREDIEARLHGEPQRV